MFNFAFSSMIFWSYIVECIFLVSMVLQMVFAEDKNVGFLVFSFINALNIILIKFCNVFLVLFCKKCGVSSAYSTTLHELVNCLVKLLIYRLQISGTKTVP